MIAVPSSAPGVSTGPVYRKLGQRGSLQADIFFEDCRVPADHAVTAAGEGYEAAERGLTAANITNAAMCLGVARAAYEAALDWSLDRVQGGVPIYRHQLVAHDLGRMKLLLDAARSYLMRTAWEYSWSPAFHPQLSWGVRVHAAEVAIEVTQKAMFLFGGRGIMTGNPAEKLVRDALTLTHGNGTSALMTLRIGEQQAQARLAGRPEQAPTTPSPLPLCPQLSPPDRRGPWTTGSNRCMSASPGGSCPTTSLPGNSSSSGRKSPTTSSGAAPGARRPARTSNGATPRSRQAGG